MSRSNLAATAQVAVVGTAVSTLGVAAAVSYASTNMMRETAMLVIGATCATGVLMPIILVLIVVAFRIYVEDPQSNYTVRAMRQSMPPTEVNERLAPPMPATQVVRPPRQFKVVDTTGVLQELTYDEP